MTTLEIDQQIRHELGTDPGPIIIADRSYAWTYCCKIATRLHDQGMEWPDANNEAANYMHYTFGVKTHGPMPPGA